MASKLTGSLLLLLLFYFLLSIVKISRAKSLIYKQILWAVWSLDQHCWNKNYHLSKQCWNTKLSTTSVEKERNETVNNTVKQDLTVIVTWKT